MEGPDSPTSMNLVWMSLSSESLNQSEEEEDGVKFFVGDFSSSELFYKETL